MPNIRPARTTDLDELYDICVKTGHVGTDASHLYTDPKLIGHIYSAPYLKYSSELSLVFEDKGQILGYVVGALDTVNFEQRLERDWWPNLRQSYQRPDQNMRSTWTADDRRCHMIHEPDITPAEVSRNFPSHLHLNLLPEGQGQGLGTKLFRSWVTAALRLGAKHAHVGINVNNEKAFRFWAKQGFRDFMADEPLPPTRAHWMVLSLA